MQRSIFVVFCVLLAAPSAKADLVEEDASYADTAIDWALTYARRDDWLADDLIPMDTTLGMVGLLVIG